MKLRSLGRTGFQISTISFGAWAIGGTWGDVDDEESLRALHRAVDLGVNFIDTADVYGDGRSERLVARLRSERKETIYVASGEMLFMFENDKGVMEEIIMRAGEAHHIPTGKKHRMIGIEDCDIFEVSTPHLDDVVRLEDNYGRTAK